MATARIRREPPQFRHATVRSVERLTPRMARVTLAGPDLDGFHVAEPAASVRLLIPSPGSDELVMPTWNGNEFLLPDGERPVIRTFTPYRVDPDALELDLLVVLHDGGVASAWAETASTGDPAAVSGPGRGYEIDPEAREFVLAGDESAIPAMMQLLDGLGADVTVEVHVEVAGDDAELALPDHPGTTVAWHRLPPGAQPGDMLVAAIETVELDPSTQVWAAGEAASMQRIRKHLTALDHPRGAMTVRGYWKRDRERG